MGITCDSVLDGSDAQDGVVGGGGRWVGDEEWRGKRPTPVILRRMESARGRVHGTGVAAPQQTYTCDSVSMELVWQHPNRPTPVILCLWNWCGSTPTDLHL